MNTLKKQMLASAMSAIVFATTVFGTPQEGVRKYENDYPDEAEQAFLQDSDQWRGTAWLEYIERGEDWQGTNLDHFGNEHSTVRLTDCEFPLCYDNEPTPVKVAVELVDDEDSGKPALFACDLRQGTYNFEKIKGDGTLRARTTDPWSSSAIVLKNYDQFVGSIETECAVVFGEVEDPERSGIGRIVIPEDATVTIAEGKHFSTQELKIDGTLVVNGALLNIEMVSGSGTVVLPAEIEDGTNIGTYGCEESTIRFSNDFTGTFSNGCRIRGNLDLGGNTIKLTGGDNTEPYVINRLVGTGILNIEEASQPIEIREVLDAYTWTIAYEGRIIGDTGKVTLPEGFKIDSHGYICRESETRYYVTLPSETTGGSYVVSNLTAECMIEPKEAGGSTYALPDGAKVGIYMVPKKGYVVTGDPYIINEIKSDKTIDAADLPKAKAPEVEYYAWDEAKKAVDGPFTTNAIPVTADMTTLESGWYVVKGSVENTTGGIVVNGDVHLILAEGAEFVVSGQVKNGMGAAGICVVGENKLNVYGETAECTGKLIAQGNYGAAGIGGVYGGSQTACGAIDIHGGIVMATGGDAAAGIGGGARGAGGVISVYGGSVTATSGVVEDGMVGAGIGGGVMGAGGEFNLWGGDVHAQALPLGAGVGGGMVAAGADVTIHGGSLTAIGGVTDDDGEVLTSSGLGCGYLGTYPGTFTVANDCSCQVLAGRDEGNLNEVDANDFAQEQEDPEDPEETIYVGWYTNVFVQITATMAPVAQPEGSQGNPWKVGAEGAEESVLAWTNGTGVVFAKGTGTPKTFGEDEEPWAGAPITEIVVPRGRGDDFKAAWTSLADLIKEVPDYLSFTAVGPTSNPEDFVIEDGVLTYYKGLDAEVAIPEGVTAIGERAFFDMKWVERVYVPKSVKNIAPLAFAMCGALEDVLFEQGTELESIEASAFAGAGVTSIAVPDSVKTVGRGAFNGCTALTEVWLGNGLETIAEDAFYDPLFGMPEEGLPIEVIYVPTGKGDAYKEMLCEALKDLVVETDESVPVFEFGSALMCTSNADEPLPLEWTDDPVGGTWADVEYGVELPLVAGKTIFLRKKGGDVALSANGLQINLSGDAFVEAHGNVMSLLDQSCQSVTVGERAFYGLFSDCAVLTTAPKLPATNLADRCYRDMFSMCVALTNAPALPAMKLAVNCYATMFYGCTSLTEAPKLSATELAANCYGSMFSRCMALTEAPELPATKLATDCYANMFDSCTSLTKAPALQATELAESCYSSMFYGCTSLTEAPELPAMTLAYSCYAGMFSGCTALTEAPELPASRMVWNCYRNMFSGCPLINEISVAFNEWFGTDNWLQDVADEGTFKCKWGLDVRVDRGASTIPVGWTVDMTIPDGCYAKPWDVGTTGAGQPSAYTNGFGGVIVKGEGVPKAYGDDDRPWAEATPAIKAIFVPQGMEEIYKRQWPADKDKIVGLPDYLSFTARNGDVKIAFGTDDPKCAIQYSFEPEDSWWRTMPSYDLGGTPESNQKISVREGMTVYFRADSGEVKPGVCDSKCSARFAMERIHPEATVEAGGNVMSLLDQTCQSKEVGELAFRTLFLGCDILTRAPKLPATKLAPSCYSEMFSDCTMLEAAPELPAAEVAEACYDTMFSACKALVSAPELPAKQLKKGCYAFMFSGCENLNSVKVGFDVWDLTACKGWLNEVAETGTFVCSAALEADFTAQNLAPSGNTIPVGWRFARDYLSFTAKGGDITLSLLKDGTPVDVAFEYSFNAGAEAWDTYSGSIQITKDQTVYFRKQGLAVGAISAEQGYWYFVFGGDGTVAAGGNVMSMLDPTCQSRTIEYNGLRRMFDSCDRLVSAPRIEADTIGSFGCANMFQDCASLTTAPVIVDGTAPGYARTSMFVGAKSLNEITVGFKKWDDAGTPWWVKNVAPFGVFRCPSELPIEVGENNIPSGWIVYKKFSIPAIEGLEHEVYDSETYESIAPIAVSQDGTKTYEVLAGDEPTYTVGFRDVDDFPVAGMSEFELGNLTESVEIGGEEYPLPERGVLLHVEQAPEPSKYTVYCDGEVFDEGDRWELTTRVSSNAVTKVVYMTTDYGWAYAFEDGQPVTEQVVLETQVTEEMWVPAPELQLDYYLDVLYELYDFKDEVEYCFPDSGWYPSVVQVEWKAKRDAAIDQIEVLEMNPLPSETAYPQAVEAHQAFTAWFEDEFYPVADEFRVANEKARERLNAAGAEMVAAGLTRSFQERGEALLAMTQANIDTIIDNENPPTADRLAEFNLVMQGFETDFKEIMDEGLEVLAAKEKAEKDLDAAEKTLSNLLKEPEVAAKYKELQASKDPKVQEALTMFDLDQMALIIKLDTIKSTVMEIDVMKDVERLTKEINQFVARTDDLRAKILATTIPTYELTVENEPKLTTYSVYTGETAQVTIAEKYEKGNIFGPYVWETPVKVVYHLTDDWYAFDGAANKEVRDFVALEDMMMGDRQIAEPALGNLKELVSTYENATGQFAAWEKDADPMPQNLKDQIKAAVDSARAKVEALYAIGVPVGETCNNINQSVNDIRLQVEDLLAQGYVALAFDLSNTLKDKHGQFLDANQGQIGALYQYGTLEANKLLEDLALLQNDVEFFCYQQLGEVKDAKSYADYVARMQELLARMEDLQTRLGESVRVIAALPLVAERNADSGTLRVIVRQTLREGEESWRIMWFMRGELDDVISRAADIVGRQVGEVFDSTLFELIPCKFAEHSSDYELSDIAAPLEEMAACVIVAIDSQGMVTRIGGVDRLDELGRGEVKGAEIIGAEPLWVHYYESKDGQLYDRDALAKPIASSPKDQLLLDQNEQSHYVVLGNCDVDSLVVKGNVNLILGRGCHLSVKNGIVIEEGSILRICSEHDFRFEPHLMGQMSVDKSAVVAERPAALCGFQSSQLQIHGGRVDIASATAGVKVGAFDMFNGEVTVTAGAGYAGVDLAYVSSRCLLDAGTLTVTGGAGAAAIGGNVGENGGQFSMNRGLLRANATPTDEGKCAAGIGAGAGGVTHGGFDFQNSELRAFAANSAAEKLNLAPNYAETREPSVLITDGGDLIRALPFTAIRQGSDYHLVMNQAPQARYLAVALTKANVFRPYGAGSTVGAALWEAVAEIATGARTAVGELTEESFFRLLRERGADSVEKIEIFSPEGCVNIASLEQVILVEFDDRGRVVRMGGVNALSELDGRGTVIDSPIGRTMTGEAAAIVAQDFTLAADSYRLTLTMTSAADNGQAWAWARVGDGELYEGLDDFVNGLLGKTVGEEAFRPLSASELPAIFGDGNWGLFTDNFAQFDRIDPKAASTLRGLVVFKVSVLPVSETGSEMPILAVGGVKNVDQLREGQRLSNQYGEGLERIANQNFTVTRQGDEEQSLLVQPADPLQGGESWHYLALGADEASWRLETINGNLSVYRGATVGDLTVDDLNYLGLSCQIAYEASFAVSGDAEAVYLFKVDGHGRVLTIGLADKLSTLYDPGMSRGDVFGKTFITAQRLGVTRSGDEWTVSVFAAEAQKAEEAGDRLVYFAYADAADAETAWSKTQGVLSGGMTEVGTVKLAEFPEPAAKGALASDEPFAALPANCAAVFAAWVRGANDVIVTLGGVTEFATIADGETRQAEAGDSRMRPFDFTVSRVEDERRTFWLRTGPRKANEQWTWMAVPSRVMYLLEQEFESSELLLENLRREMFVSKDAGLVKGVQKQKEPAAIQMLRLMLGRGYFGQSTDAQLDVQDIPADTDLLLVMKTDRGTGATCGQGLVIGLEQLPPGGEKRNQVDGRLVYATVDEAGNRTLHETAEPVELVTELTRSIGGNRWYVLGDRGLYEKIRAGDRLTVNGAANVIVPDGSTSDAFKSGRIRLYGGIAVNAGATLNVYGQQLGNGALQVVGADGCAAIGGDEECGAGTINFYGGIVEAESGLGAAAIGGGYLNGGENGAVNLYGGVVIARAFDAAAIGGGQLGSGCDVVLHPAASVICDVEESGLPGIGGCDGMYDGTVQAFGDKRVFIATDTDEELVYRPQDYYLGDVRRGNFLSAELLTVSLPKDARFACKVASATLGGDIGGVLPGDDAYTYKAVRGDTVVVGAEIAGKGVGELYGFRSPNVLKFNCVQDDVTVTADDFKVAMRRAVAPLDYTVSRDFNGELYLTSGETFGANEQLVWMAVPEVMEPTANIPATAQLFDNPVGLMRDLIMTGAQVGDEFCDTFALMLGAKNWGLEFNYDGRPVALPADARHVLAFKVYDGGKFALQAGGSHKKEEKPSLKANKSDAAGTRRMPIIKVGAVADVMYVTPDAPQPNQVFVESVIARQPFSLTRNEDGTFRLSLNGTLQDWIGEQWGFATVSAEVWDLVKAGGIEDLTADMMTDLLDSQIGRPFGFFTLDDLGGYRDIFAQFETSGEHVFTCNADTAVVLAFKVRESGDKGADVCTLGYTVDSLQAMAPGGDERKTNMIDGTTDAPACFVTVVNMPAGVTAHLDYVYNDAWSSCAPDAEGEGTAEFSVPEGAKVELRFEPPHGMTFRSKETVTIESLQQDEIVDASFLVVAPRDLIVPQDLVVCRASDGTFNLMLPNEQLDLSAGERWLYVALNELDSATCMEGEAAPFGVLLWSMGGMALGQAVGDIVANEFAFAMRNGYSGFVTDGNVTLPKDTVMVVVARCFNFTDSDGTDQTCLVTVGGRNNLQSLGESEMGDNEIEDSETLEEYSLVHYLEWDKSARAFVGGEAHARRLDAAGGVIGNGQWYVNSPDDAKHSSETLTVQGTANLVIRDMTALQLRRIVVGEGATLNVYGQSMREGMLMIKDNSMSGAAFGADGVCGTINLHGVQAMVQGTAVGIGGMVEGGELNVLGANLQVSSKGPAIAGCALNVYGGRVLAASMSGGEYPAINDGISLKSNKLSIFSGSGSLTELDPTTVAAYTAERKPVAKIAEHVNVIVPQVEHVNVTATSIDIEGADVSVVEPEELPGTGCVRYRFERFDNVKLGFAADTGYQLRSPDGYVFFSIDGDRRLAADAVVVTAVSQPPEMIGRQPFTAYRTTDENGQPCCEVKPIGELGPGEQWLWMSCDKALAQTKGTVDDDLTTEEALVEMLDGVVGNVPVGYVSVDMFRAMLPLDRSGVGGADAVIRLPADTDMVCLGKVYDTGLGEMGQRYSNITVGLATNLFERLEGGDAGHNDLGEEPTDDEIEAILKEAFPEPHEVTQDEDGSFRITLMADMTGPVEIPDNLGALTLDMNGFAITGVNGVNGADGGNALVITDSGDVGADTELTITEPNEKYDADGDIVGGNGADGQRPGNGGAAIRVDTKRGVRINVEGTVQVVGGKGGTVLGDEDSHTKPGAPGKGVEPSGTRGDRAPGSDQEGEVGGTFAPWAKATLAAEAPDNLQTLLPDGVTVVGNELWFWKRVGTNSKAVGFDFTTLDRAWIKDGEIRFVAGSHFVDQFLYNRAGGLAFVGASSAAVVVKPEPVKPADPEEKPVKPVLKAGMLGGKDSGIPDLGKHTTLASTGKSIFQSKNAPVVNGPLTASYSGAPATWRNLAFTMLPGTVIEGNGGAINAANVHALTVADCAFANIIAGELGGAICAAGLDEGGLITNSTFTACSVSDANGMGGAIYATAGRAPVQPGLFGKKSGSDPGLAVVDCIFALNVAESGGAICTALTYEEEEPIALKVSGTSFIGNFADYNGGAIYAGGKVELLDAEIDRGTFFGSNEAGVYGGALAAGGTEDTFAGTEVFVGSNTVFACNKVENDWFGEAMGGAINLPENCALTVRNALFTNNVARCSGGAVYGVYGGAVCTATGCTNRFEKTAFVDNHAIAAGTEGNRYAAGGAISDLEGVTRVDTCVFDANVVEGAACVGAALDFEYGKETTVVNSTFRRSNVEAVSVYAVVAAEIRNCVIVGNGADADLYVEETAGYELTFTAYGKLCAYTSSAAASSNNFENCVAEKVYRGETLYLATNEYNKVAALGYPQPGVTDFEGVEYGSTFWGTSMGAFETPAIYPVDQLGFDIYVDPLELAWTGTQVQPSSVVVTNPYTHVELTEGVDYTVGFMNNVDSTDKALVVVTGIGNYAGTATTNYWITSYLVKYYACENNETTHRLLDAVELGSLSGSNVVATIAPPPGYALDPYHEGSLTNGTVSLYDSAAGDEDNGRLVLKVFYAPSGDDDVPDKYQRKITYKVANGWWNDAEDGLDKTVWVTLFDADGKWSETGTGTLTDIPSAGERPFSGYAKAGVWYSDPPTVEMSISHDTPSLPFFLYVYCPQPQGGTTGRGGRGSSGSVTQADLDALKSHLVTKLTITDFAYVNGKAAGEARAAVVDELTGQTILDELLRRTKIDILATPSLDKGEWSVIGSSTTDGEGGWGVDERPAAETPAQMFFKLRLR